MTDQEFGALFEDLQHRLHYPLGYSPWMSGCSPGLMGPSSMFDLSLGPSLVQAGWEWYSDRAWRWGLCYIPLALLGISLWALPVVTTPPIADQSIQAAEPVAGVAVVRMDAGRAQMRRARPVKEQGREAQEKAGEGAVPQAQSRGAMLPGEANSAGPSREDLEKMAKRRFQAPKPKREGQWWYLLYRQDEIVKGRRQRKKVRVKLAPATMPEREVQKLAAEYLRPMNQGLQSLGSATLFMDFLEDTYRPAIMPTLAASTQERYESALKVHLVPTFGAMPMRDITPLVVQRYMAAFRAGTLSHESVDKIRDVLAAVLGAATKYGLLVKNPVKGVRLPPPKKRRSAKPFLTPEQLALLIDSMPEPYASMVFTAGYTGLRPSEVIGLRWGDIGEDSIRVDERYWRGDWSIPKSEASAATIPVRREVIERFHRLRVLTVEVRAGRAVRHYRVVKFDGPEDLVFQSLKDGGPMRDNNVLTRHIKPAARKLGIGWANWQVLRRSFATMLKQAGADVKDAQALMRHSRASTTLDIYQQHIPASQRRVVEDLGRLTQPSLAVN